MARYTVQLRKVIETIGEDQVLKWFQDYDLTNYLTFEEIKVITDKGTWSPARLARKIIDHYYMDEIGSETVALFKHRVKVAMQEIMEEKLPLIYSASLQYNPLTNVNYTETYTGENTSANTTSSNSTATSDSSGLTVNSDTPQGQINKQSILKGTYASSTSANEIEDSAHTTSSGSSNGSGTQIYTKHFEGNQGISATYQKMIEQYRDNIRMIDREIIEDLRDLFMVIY
jgi:hypothetical protein